MEIASNVCRQSLRAYFESRVIINKTFRKRMRSRVFGDKTDRDRTIRPTVLNNDRTGTEN